MSFGFHPTHIATRGRFDGEYGIATRGYLICPDIVPRFPFDAELFVELDQIGVADPNRLFAQFGEHGDFTFVAGLMDIDMEALLMVEDQVARTRDLDMSAEIELLAAELGMVVADDLIPGLGVEGDTGVVTDEDAAGTIETETDDPVGDADGEEPPHC